MYQSIIEILGQENYQKTLQNMANLKSYISVRFKGGNLF